MDHPVRFARAGAGQEVGPPPLQAIAPAEGPHERPRKKPVEKLVELPPVKADSVEPAEERLGKPAIRMTMPQMAPHGVLEQVVIVQKRRRPQKLKRSQARMPDDVDQ